MNYLSVFFTHSGAIKYNRFLNSQGITNELMPVPRKLSSNCSIAARFAYEDDIKNIISEDIEKLYKLQDKEYMLIYESD
jgi:hypothetical protein